MTTPIKETAILELKARFETMLEANYPGAWKTSRSPNYDPKELPNRSVFLGILEGPSSPMEEDCNVQCKFEAPVYLSIRYNVASEDADTLTADLNTLEQLFIQSLRARLTTAGTTVSYYIKGVERELGNNLGWIVIELSLMHPIP